MTQQHLSLNLNTITEEMHAIIAALIGGARYGIKIRLPHALVMTMLFRQDLTSKQKISSVIKLATEHAYNLASFATVYKSILSILKWSSRYLRSHPGYEKSIGRWLISILVDGPFSVGTHNLPSSMAGHPERPYHALVAGATGGYFIWGKYSSVNYQIVLYLTSRVLVGLAKRILERVYGGIPHGHDHPHENNNNNNNILLKHPKAYPILVATIWGIVMALFEESPHVLHRSLKQSMDEIYRHQPSWISTTSSSSNVQDE